MPLVSDAIAINPDYRPTAIAIAASSLNPATADPINNNNNIIYIYENVVQSCAHHRNPPGDYRYKYVTVYALQISARTRWSVETPCPTCPQ